MSKSIRFILISYLMAFCMPLFAQKTQPVVDKETIKKVQQELKTQMPKAKIKTIKYDDGGVYVGECDKKIKQGVGTMFFATGDVYIGQWESDVISGQGSIIYANGTVYEGQLKDNQKNGIGKLTIDKLQYKEGEWKDDLFVNGTWCFGEGYELKGHWGDSGFEGHANYFDGVYTYNGTCKIPGNSSIDKTDIWKLIEFQEGTLKWDNNVISGNWDDSKVIKNGTFYLEDPGASIKGEFNDGKFDGTFKTDNEIFQGIFSSDGNFDGTYTLRELGQSYVFTGLMKKGRPTFGTIKHGSYSGALEARYPTDGRTVLTLRGNDGKKLDVSYRYSDNAHLFSNLENRISLSKELSFQAVFEKDLNDQLYRQSFEDYPMGGVKQYVFWSFYADHIALRSWQNERFYHRASEDKKKHSDSVCPVCNGTGKAEEHGYTVDGHPYTRVIKCLICNGAGNVKADNVLANIQKDIWAEVAANPLYVNSEGRDSYDVSKDRGAEIFTYSVDGNKIIINETGQQFVISNHYYTITSLEEKIQYHAIENGKESSIRRREHIEEFNPYTHFRKRNGTIIKNPYLPFSFYGGDIAEYGNEFLYKATAKQNIVVKNGVVLSHDFENGIGKIVTDKIIIDYMKERASSSSYSSSAMAGLGGGSYSSSKIDLLDNVGCTVIIKVNSETEGSLQEVYTPFTVPKEEIITRPEEDEPIIPIQLVENKPSFNGGGLDAFTKWVDKNKVYPQTAKKAGIQGRVTVNFIIDSKGQVRDVKVERGVDKALDDEAVRVISSSPNWTPALQRGEPVAVRVSFPVIFQLR